MARASADKYWLEVNPALCRILGSNAQTLLGKTWAEMTHPDDLPGSLIHFEAILRGESNGYSMERRFVCDDGLIIHTFMSTYAIRKPNGQLDCLAIVVEDLSNWILAEKEWERSAKTLQRFVDHMPGTAYIKDADRRILVAGKGFTNLLGVDPRQMIGHTSEEFFRHRLAKKSPSMTPEFSPAARQKSLTTHSTDAITNPPNSSSPGTMARPIWAASRSTLPRGVKPNSSWHTRHDVQASCLSCQPKRRLCQSASSCNTHWNKPKN